MSVVVRWAQVAVMAAFTVATQSLPARATPFMEADGTNTNGDVVGGCVTLLGGGASTGPVEFHIECADGNGTARVDMRAAAGHVGGEVSGSGLASFIGGALFRDTVRFTSNDPAVTTTSVALNANLGGLLSIGDPGESDFFGMISLGGDSCSISSSLDSSAGLKFSNTCTVLAGGPPISGSSVPVSLGIATPTVIVPTDTDISFALQLDLHSSFTASARFPNSIDLPIGVDVFTLSDGVTANAPDSFIINNRFLPRGATAVAEPASATLYGVGWLFVAWQRSRRRGAEVKQQREAQLRT